MQRLTKVFKTTAVLLLWLAVWQLAALAVEQEIIIPTPLATLKSLLVLGSDAAFYLAVLLSLFRIISGYALGIIIGVLGALLSYRFGIFKAIFSPILKIIKAVPVASFIILAFVWFQSDILPVFISFLMVLPMVWSSVETGLSEIDKQYLELARVFRLDSIKTFFHIKLPLILPSFVATALTALGFAWKSGIAAEVICRPQISLGDMLQEAKIYISTPDVFALTAVVAALSVLLEFIIKKLLRRYTNDKH